MKIGTFLYGPTETTSKITFTVEEDKNGNKPLSLVERDFEQFAPLYDITKKLGEEFESELGTLGRIKFVGYRVKARKFPFIVEQVESGNKIVMGAMQAQNHSGK